MSAVRANTNRRRPRGFTLLEVLIAIALVGVLLGSMFAFMHELLQSRSRAMQYTARQLAAATLIDRIESDLAVCIVGDATLGAGIRGDDTQLSILSRGVAAHLAGVTVPMLFLNGTRDKLAGLELLEPVCDDLGARARLHVVGGADHAFHVLKRSGRTDVEVLHELATATGVFVTGLI